MPKPGSHGTVHYHPQSMDRVQSKSHRDESCAVVQGRLHRVHVGPREGGGIVRLMMKAVHLE